MKRHRHTMVAEPIEPRCIAQRGRYQENPKLRVAGPPTEQMFEAREDGKTNTLTTVQKDNQVAVPVNIIQNGKARTLIAGYHKQGIENCCGFVGFGSIGVAEPINCTEVGKEITIYEVKDGKITIKGKQYPIKLKDGFYIIRKLTVRECMRLQTVPEWYEFPMSDTQAYKMLGNGWTCEVIAHILKSLKEA